MNDYLESCENMALLIESCYDCNNPGDGKTFDERLMQKVKGLTGTDKEAIMKVTGWCWE